MNVRDLSKDDILGAIGLETRRTATDYILPALGVFSAGILVGAGLGLMFAPKSGRELRGDIRERLTERRGTKSGDRHPVKPTAQA